MPFVIRKLNDARSLGEEIKALRQATGWTLSEMEARTKVRRGFLEAFEADRCEDLPETLYARNYLRTYLQALGVHDPDYYIQRFEESRGTCDFTGASLLPRQRVRKASFLVLSRFFKVSTVAAVALGVVFYMGVEIRAITAAPSLSLLGPDDGIATAEANVAVTGQTDPGTTIKVNGQDVLINSDGSFETTVALERGLNVIKVEGAKRYSRPASAYRRVVLEADKSTALAPNAPTMP